MTMVAMCAAGNLLLPVAMYAQNNVQRYVDGTLKTDPRLKNAAVALLAVDEAGRTVAAWNPDQPLLTASTMKTITTGVALDVLGEHFCFETTVATAGETDADGTLHGDVYIIGGGDPTLGSHSDIAEPVDLVFAKWKTALGNCGITSIDGKIVADASLFSNDIIPETWSWNNIGTDFGSGPCGLSFAENLSYYRVEPGLEEGDYLWISPVRWVYSEMDLQELSRTGAPGTGNKLNYYASDLSPSGRFTGTYAVDRRVDTIAVSNKFPALTCAEAFAGYLANEGICNLGARYAAAPDTARAVAKTYSPTLLTICRETNTISNNFYAETLLMMLGLHLCGEADYPAATAAVEEYIGTVGCDTTGLKQADGSGLSRQNYVSPRFFCNFFKMMEKSTIFAGYLSTFPTPGAEGTLKYVLAKEPGQLRSRIHCKSGSLDSVRCYAGYVEAPDGSLLRFAIQVNNYDCATREIQPAIEGFLKQLALYERQ